MIFSSLHVTESLKKSQFSQKKAIVLFLCNEKNMLSLTIPNHSSLLKPISSLTKYESSQNRITQPMFAE